MTAELGLIDNAYRRIAAKAEPASLERSPVTVIEIARATGIPTNTIINLIWNNADELNLQLNYPEEIYQENNPKNQRLARTDFERSLAPPKKTARLVQELIKTGKTDSIGRSHELGTKINSMRNIQKPNPWKKIQGQLGPGRLKVKPKTFEPKQSKPIPETLKPEIGQLIKWLKQVGPKNWIYGGQLPLLKESLAAFSQGEPVDFIIWNCIGFDWLPNQNNGYPPCRLNDNLEAAITLYYREKLLELSYYLAKIGAPNLFVLTPSNEALYEEMWTYTQTFEERQALLSRTVAGLSQGLNQISWPETAKVKAIRWDDYLKLNDIVTPAKEYSFAGTAKIINSPNFPDIQQSAIADGEDYFRQYGIQVKKSVLAEKRIIYDGMYAGEGIALKEIKNQTGKKFVVINLEEFRVAKRTYFGADENLPIITPIKPREMEKYYRWENEIQKTRMQAL